MENPPTKKAIKEKKAELKAAKENRDENGPVSGFKDSDMNVMAHMHEDAPKATLTPEQTAYNKLRDLNDSAEVGVFGPESAYDDPYREKLLKFQEEKDLELYQAKELMDWRYPQTEEIAASKEFEIDKKARLLKRKEDLTMSKARKKAERQLEKELLRDLKKNSPLSELNARKDEDKPDLFDDSEIDKNSDQNEVDQVIDDMYNYSAYLARNLNHLKEVKQMDPDTVTEKYGSNKDDYIERIRNWIREDVVSVNRCLDRFKDLKIPSDIDMQQIMGEIGKILGEAMRFEDEKEPTPTPINEPPTAPTEVIQSEDDEEDTNKTPKKSLVAQEREDVETNMKMREKIDAADKLKGRARIKALGELATSISNPNLAIEAAERIRKSEVNNPFARVWRRRLRADSDYYLHKIATEKQGNSDAAEAMSRSKYRRFKQVDKGSDDAYRNIATIKKDSTLLENISFRGVKEHHRGLVEIAADTNDPTLVDSVNSLYDFFKKEETKAAIAVSVAKGETTRPGNKEKGIKIAKSIKWPSTRNKALFEISQLQ